MKIFGYFHDPAILNRNKFHQDPLNRGMEGPRAGWDVPWSRLILLLRPTKHGAPFRSPVAITNDLYRLPNTNVTEKTVARAKVLEI